MVIVKNSSRNQLLVNWQLIGYQQATNKLLASYQQTLEGLLTVGLCLGQNLPAICHTEVGPKRPTGN